MEIPQFDIAWNLFNLQDAINFAEFAIKTTADTMSFQNRLKLSVVLLTFWSLNPKKPFG